MQSILFIARMKSIRVRDRWSFASSNIYASSLLPHRRSSRLTAPMRYEMIFILNCFDVSHFVCRTPCCDTHCRHRFNSIRVIAIAILFARFIDVMFQSTDDCRLCRFSLNRFSFFGTKTTIIYSVVRSDSHNDAVELIQTANTDIVFCAQTFFRLFFIAFVGFSTFEFGFICALVDIVNYLRTSDEGLAEHVRLIKWTLWRKLARRTVCVDKEQFHNFIFSPFFAFRSVFVVLCFRWSMSVRNKFVDSFEA